MTGRSPIRLDAGDLAGFRAPGKIVFEALADPYSHELTGSWPPQFQARLSGHPKFDCLVTLAHSPAAGQDFPEYNFVALHLVPRGTPMPIPDGTPQFRIAHNLNTDEFFATSPDQRLRRCK